MSNLPLSSPPSQSSQTRPSLSVSVTNQRRFSLHAIRLKHGEHFTYPNIQEPAPLLQWRDRAAPRLALLLARPDLVHNRPELRLGCYDADGEKGGADEGFEDDVEGERGRQAGRGVFMG